MGTGSGLGRREVIGGVLLVAVLAGGGLVLLQGDGGDPGLEGTTATLRPSTPSAPKPPMPPATSGTDAAAPTPPATATPNATDGADQTGGVGDASVTGPGRHRLGRIELDFLVPRSDAAASRKYVELFFPADSGPIATKTLAATEVNGVWRVVLSPVVARSIRFFADVPGRGSGGPFQAVVPPDGTGRAGPFQLQPLGGIALHLEPDPSVPWTNASYWVTPIAPRTEPGPTRTRSDALFKLETEIEQLPAGGYQLRLIPERHAVVTRRDIRVQAGAIEKVRIELRPQARIPLQILDASGRPPGTLILRLGLPDGTELRHFGEITPKFGLAIVVVGGSIKLDRLPAGRVAVSAARGLNGPFTEIGVLNLEPGDNAPATFTWRD